LEEHDLPLYRRCLESRFKRPQEIERDWSDQYAREYLGQVRSSYLRIVDAHLGQVKMMLPPWREPIGQPDPAARPFALSGVIRSRPPAIEYRFRLLDATSRDSELVTAFVPRPRTGPKPNDPTAEGTGDIARMEFANGAYYDLRAVAFGIDSAREVAFDKV